MHLNTKCIGTWKQFLFYFILFYFILFYFILQKNHRVHIVKIIGTVCLTTSVMMKPSNKNVEQVLLLFLVSVTDFYIKLKNLIHIAWLAIHILIFRRCKLHLKEQYTFASYQLCDHLPKATSLSFNVSDINITIQMYYYYQRNSTEGVKDAKGINYKL